MWLEQAHATKREAFEMVLATNEAFANAIEHPFEPSAYQVDVEGTISDQAITISVRDYGTWPDGERRKVGGGLGLVIMERLADVVQFERLVEGTTVTMSRRLTQT